MSHTAKRLSWAIGLGLTATTLLHGPVAAEPATTTDPGVTTETSGPAAFVPPTRDQWYLDSPTARSAPAISVQFRDRWYVDDYAPYSMQARSHRSQEEAVHIG